MSVVLNLPMGRNSRCPPPPSRGAGLFALLFLVRYGQELLLEHDLNVRAANSDGELGAAGWDTPAAGQPPVLPVHQVLDQRAARPQPARADGSAHPRGAGRKHWAVDCRSRANMPNRTLCRRKSRQTGKMLGCLPREDRRTVSLTLVTNPYNYHMTRGGAVDARWALTQSRSSKSYPATNKRPQGLFFVACFRCDKWRILAERVAVVLRRYREAATLCGTRSAMHITIRRR